MQDGASCLMVASQNGHLEVVRYLCERGGEKLLLMADNVSVYVRRHVLSAGVLSVGCMRHVFGRMLCV